LRARASSDPVSVRMSGILTSYRDPRFSWECLDLEVIHVASKSEGRSCDDPWEEIQTHPADCCESEVAQPKAVVPGYHNCFRMSLLPKEVGIMDYFS
jgi:hypothetical protein